MTAPLIMKRSASSATVMEFTSYCNAGTTGQGGVLGYFPISGNVFNGSLTVNISTQGLGGRVETATYSSGNEIHFYVIPSGGGFGIYSYLSPPSSMGGGVPWNSPSGTTTFAYLSSVILDGSGNLPDVYQAGNLVTYINAAVDAVALSGGTAVSSSPNTAVSLTSLVPSVAEQVNLYAAMNNTNAGILNQLQIGVQSGKKIFGANANPDPGGIGTWDTLSVFVPNVGQNVYYANMFSGGNAYINVLGYTVPLL